MSNYRRSAQPGTPAKVVAVKPELLEILGPPPLLIGENEEEYRGLHDRVREAVAPADMLEELWVRDIVDNTWELLRLRREMAKLMDARRRWGLERTLEDLGVSFAERKRIAEGWIIGDPVEKAEVKRLLKSAGLDAGIIEAHALAMRLDDFERLDRMIALVEVRRNAAIREVDRHRDTVARRVREAIADVEDLEFDDAPPVAADAVMTEAVDADSEAAE
jgi:hypothetical protein